MKLQTPKLRYFIFLTIFICLISGSCKKVPIFATAGAELTVYSDKTYLKTGGDKAALTVVGFKADGEPLHDHTLVTLITNFGTVQPAEVELVNGAARADFFSPERSGTASITARSGNIVSKNPLVLTIGSAALKSLTMLVNPTHFFPGGGKSTISIYAYDESANTLSDISVVISATTGIFERGGGVQVTDKNGMIVSVLRVDSDSTVSAVSGSIKAAEVTIKVDQNKPPQADFSYSPSYPVKKENIYFNGELSKDEDGYIVSYSWDFGDGTTAQGAKVTHAYDWSANVNKTFTVVLKVMDNNGSSAYAQKPVQVSYY